MRFARRLEAAHRAALYSVTTEKLYRDPVRLLRDAVRLSDDQCGCSDEQWGCFASQCER